MSLNQTLEVYRPFQGLMQLWEGIRCLESSLRGREQYSCIVSTTPPKEVFHLHQVRMISTFENNWGPCIVFGDHGGCLGQIYPLPRERLLDDDLYNTRIGDRVIIKYNSLSARILISTLSCNVYGSAPILNFQIPKELSPRIKNDFPTFCKMITFYHTWAMETCFPNPEFVTHISCLAYLSLFLRKPKLTVGWVANLIRLARHVWMNKISYRTSIHLFSVGLFE